MVLEEPRLSMQSLACQVGIAADVLPADLNGHISEHGLLGDELAAVGVDRPSVPQAVVREPGYPSAQML